MTPNTLFFSAALLCSTALLSACGGGNAADNQLVNQIQVKTLSYGKQAEIYVAGLNLRANMTAVTGACKDPVFNITQSVPELAVLNCTVSATGVQPIRIIGANGETLYTSTLTVPEPRVALVTSAGTVYLELNPTAAPVTVNNFLAYVSSGYYRNTLFHRVIAGFVAQAGGYTTGLVKKTGQRSAIELESNKGLLNTRSSLAMARTNVPASATSEFFINLVDNPSLNYQSDSNPGYAVFGKVVQGMDVVDAIATSTTGTVNGFSDVPLTEVTITFALQTQ
jgi:cyclophilin family peptidyl-prolyl cis-trans isomerase